MNVSLWFQYALHSVAWWLHNAKKPGYLCTTHIHQGQYKMIYCSRCNKDFTVSTRWMFHYGFNTRFSALRDGCIMQGNPDVCYSTTVQLLLYCKKIIVIILYSIDTNSNNKYHLSNRVAMQCFLKQRVRFRWLNRHTFTQDGCAQIWIT